MTYEGKNFDGLLGMEGFSDTLLKNHFTLYQGYVANTNKVAGLLMAMAKEGKTTVPEYAELKRRFGWEFNGMRLHELYFGNMAKGSAKPDVAPKLSEMLVAEFGSLENWEMDFRATGAMRGIGWVILYYDLAGKRLFNMWINEHDVGHPSSCAPLLVMDVFEHAYMTDYGLKRAEYINAFFKNLNWKEAEARIARVSV
ncbi:MAG: Fe-Mn family superoxide dismutase [Candidatus Micrarchaeota archaeon]